MATKLYNHFRAMQNICAAYIADHETPKAKADQEFIHAMIVALDGPDERESIAEYNEQEKHGQ